MRKVPPYLGPGMGRSSSAAPSKKMCSGRSTAVDDQQIMEIWSEIKKFVALNPGIYTTIWKNGRQGVRFKAENKHGDMYISVQDDESTAASGEAPAGKSVQGYRSIGKLKDEDFLALYPLYLRRKNGEAVSHEAGRINRRPIYFWGLVYWAYEQKKKPLPD